MWTPATGEQLEAIRAFLTEHTEILYVWFDFGCLPQRKNTPAKEPQRVVLARNKWFSLPSLRCSGKEGLLRHKMAGSHWLNMGAS